MLKLIIQSATKSIFGQWELSIQINGKAYNYYLSDYGYQKAMQLYNKGLQGRALAVLNKHREDEGVIMTEYNRNLTKFNGGH